MSKDPYYQLARNSGAATSADGMSLPSFPSTSFWYDAHAHSSVGISIFPQPPSAADDPGPSSSSSAYNYKQEHCEAKNLQNGREGFECWTDGLHQSNLQKTFDGQYWSEGSTQRGFDPPCNVSGGPVEYEPSRHSLQLLSSSEVVPPQQEVHIGGGGGVIAGGSSSSSSSSSMYVMETSSQDEYDDRLTNNSVISSEEYYPHSNSSSDAALCSKKKTSEGAAASSEDPKKNQKKLKKETKEKVKEEKKCGVCGDAARSMHFGGMACDSCKAFFRRSVQSGAYKNFQCPENEQCPISKQNRKVCQYCRFKKSQENGMEISWVMSETDRMTLWKNRLAKQRHVQEEKIKDEVYGDLPRTLDPDEADKLRNLALIQESTFASLPYPEDCYGDRVESLANLFVCICKKLGMFFYKIQDFGEICKNDQSLLLKNGIGMSIYLHGAYMYDYENEIWPAENNKEAFKIPRVSMHTLKKFTVYPDAFNAIMKFYKKYGKELKDEIILALMCIIAFFQPDDPQFRYPGKIQDIQVTYLEHLRHYLLAKEGDSGVKVTFPKLLVGLADIREILEFHSKVDIKPTINHQQIVTQSSLKHQMAAVHDVFAKGSQGFFPDFSSVLTSSEKQHPIWKRNERSLSRRHRQRSGAAVHAGDQFYHPQTNQIFGSDPRTDMIITNPMDQIDRFIKKHKLSIAQVSEVADYNGRGALQPKYFKSSYDSSSSRSDNEIEYPQPEASASRQLQLIPHNSGWENRCSSPPTDKKRAVEVLCDILKHISCSNDDDDLLQSLKQNLPPQLLDNLAQKLSPV
ncbi:ecdysone-induced protein 75B-like isoform X2 [Macrobrachium nipponense]